MKFSIIAALVLQAVIAIAAPVELVKDAVSKISFNHTHVLIFAQGSQPCSRSFSRLLCLQLLDDYATLLDIKDRIASYLFGITSQYLSMLVLYLGRKSGCGIVGGRSLNPRATKRSLILVRSVVIASPVALFVQLRYESCEVIYLNVPNL